MRIKRAVIAMCIAPLIAAGCATGGNYTGYGEVDRSGLGSGPPRGGPGVCYAAVVHPPSNRGHHRGDRPGYRKVTRTVKERVPGGKGIAVWRSPDNVPRGARVIASRKRDGALLVVLNGRGGYRTRKVTKWVRTDDAGGHPHHLHNGKARAAWARVVCDGSTGTIRAVQQKLSKRGYYDGPIDGDYNRGLKSAITAFQVQNRLAVGGLTRQTTRRLGVRF